MAIIFLLSERQRKELCPRLVRAEGRDRTRVILLFPTERKYIPSKTLKAKTP